MTIFISWSGERSKQVAAALSQWLPDVIQSIKPWMSDHDIHAGSRWGAELDAVLEKAHFGVLCLTPENINKPWLLFEAGSLSKSISEARVVPYRFNLTSTDVKPPLSQFQGVDATAEGTHRLLQSINKITTNSIAEERLERLFNLSWSTLEKRLAVIPENVSGVEENRRNEIDYLQEILELIRRQASEQDFNNFEGTLGYIFRVLNDLRGQSKEGLQNYINRTEAAWDYGRNQEARRLWEIALQWQELLDRNEQKPHI